MDMPTIFAELDDAGYTDISPTRKLTVVQAVVWDIERRYPWPFLEKSMVLAFDGTNPLPTNMPADFRASVRVKDLTTGRRLTYTRVEEWEDAVGLDYAQTGVSSLYYFEGSSINVWRIPSASAQMRLRYIRWSPTLTASSIETDFLIPKYFHRDTIVNGALQRLAVMDDDTELAPMYQTYMENGIDTMVEAVFARQYDLPDHVLVTDADDWDYDNGSLLL
jgi:hypothetical protein